MAPKVKPAVRQFTCLLPPFPVRAPQLRLQDLACARHRQRFGLDRHAASGICSWRCGCGMRRSVPRPRRLRWSWLQPDDGMDTFAPGIVWHADHGAFGDGRMGVKRFLDFRGVDVLRRR